MLLLRFVNSLNLIQLTVLLTSTSQDEGMPRRSFRHSFQVSHVHCIETATWACGYPIAFGKMYRSEGEAQVLEFLEKVWPASATQRPSYIAFDRACKLLKYISTSIHRCAWLDTTRFVVDTWHYINHRSDDELCRVWCNPAPKDGSQPDLVLITISDDEEPIQSRAFNLEAAEQQNSWIGGYSTAVNKMTDYNHDFFLFSVLFLHAKDWERRRDAETALEERRELRAENRDEMARTRLRGNGSLPPLDNSLADGGPEDDEDDSGGSDSDEGTENDGGDMND
jgi:hypothetical protein